MLFGSFCSFVYAGFALELFWFLATGNTDFLFFSSFAPMFFSISLRVLHKISLLLQLQGSSFFWQACVPCNINPVIPN